MSAGTLKPRWGQPLTGIIAFLTFFAIGWFTWYILGDPRGPVGWFPYPFVMILALMILVGLWHHMLFANWPFQNLPQPTQGIVMTVGNIILVWFVIEVIFYRILGSGFNFFNYYGLQAIGKHIFAQVAIVGFVLVGFYTYPVITIYFGKWPVPPDLKQPDKGILELSWTSLITLFFYTLLIVPYIGAVLPGAAISVAWWEGFAGTQHVHWVFGWWEWTIVILFLTANVWRGKPWTAIILPQPWKGLVCTAITFVLAFLIGTLCTKLVPVLVPAETLLQLQSTGGDAEVQRFLWLHSAELAGFTLIFFLVWHHYFDDMVPKGNIDSQSGFVFRTVGVLALAAISYGFYYHCNFGNWGLGNHHMENVAERFSHGESLLWNFWWIIPLLWNEWFFHKWPFYVHDDHH